MKAREGWTSRRGDIAATSECKSVLLDLKLGVG